MDTIRKGELNFALQITKKSGGIIPSNDSESKNTVNTSQSEKWLEINLKTALRSIRYFPIRTAGIMTAR
jgi:hypothetical protein